MPFDSVVGSWMGGRPRTRAMSLTAQARRSEPNERVARWTSFSEGSWIEPVRGPPSGERKRERMAPLKVTEPAMRQGRR